MTRDFAFIVDRGVAAGDLLKAVKSGAGPLLSDMNVFDLYEGATIGEGKKSVAVTITLTPTKPPKPGITCELDDNETISGGVGGWETLDRPRNTPATAWVGTPAKTLELPLLLDGREAGGIGIDQMVEGACRRLERWGLPTGKTGQPDILRVDGLVRVSSASRWASTRSTRPRSE